MELFNVPMRAVTMPPTYQAPSLHSPAATGSPVAREPVIDAAPMPTELTSNAHIPAPPAGISPFAWEMLLVNIVDVQRRSAAAFAPLREAVKTVVRELRAVNQTWDQVYEVLQGVVAPAPEHPVSWAMGYEMYASRSAVLVAHMQSWADGERLAEIEAEAHAG